MFFYIIVYVLIFLIFNSIYQLIRNEAVFKIRVKWIETGSELDTKFSYDFMHSPNKTNWYGLKYPNEKDYIKLFIGTEPKE